MAKRSAFNADEWITTLENPGVHDFADWLTRGGFECRPQIGCHGVGIGVTLEIEANAVSEHRFAEILLEHAQHRAALDVGQDVEHSAAVIWRNDLILNGPS